MAHKIVIKFETANNVKMIRDSWVSAIWYLLAVNDREGTQKLHDSPLPKGFVWHVKSPAPNKYTMEFSSIKPELIDAIKNAATKFKDEGSAFPISDDIFLKVTDIIPVSDFFLGSSVIRLSPVTGVIVDQKVPVEPASDPSAKAKTFKRIPIYPNQDPFAFCRRLKLNLLYKAKILLGQEFSLDDIRLRIISSGKAKDMPFRKIPLRGNLCSVQIEGPRQILETALYAGIGRMNGLGFGMMTFAKKASACRNPCIGARIISLERGPYTTSAASVATRVLGREL